MNAVELTNDIRRGSASTDHEDIGIISPLKELIYALNQGGPIEETAADFEDMRWPHG
jgi:hypothetical protein